MSKAKLVTWCVKQFPEGVKNQFIGMAKIRNKTVRVALLEAIQLWIKAQGGVSHGS